MGFSSTSARPPAVQRWSLESGRLDLNQRPLAPKASALNHAAPRPERQRIPHTRLARKSLSLRPTAGLSCLSGLFGLSSLSGFSGLSSFSSHWLLLTACWLLLTVHCFSECVPVSRSLRALVFFARRPSPAPPVRVFCTLTHGDPAP